MPGDVGLPAEGLAVRWVTRWWDPITRGYGPPAQDIAVYADGTVVGASTVDAEVQPMVWPYVTGTIPVAEVTALLELAGESDLLDFSTAFEIRDANRDVAGAPVTFVTLRTADGEVTHAVHALQTPSDPEIVGGSELRTLIDELQARTATALDPLTAPYADPTHVAVIAVPADGSDGSSPEPWPGDPALADAAPCAVTGDTGAIDALRQRISGERFTDADVTYSVRAYQLIPGELFCYGSVPSAEEPASSFDVIRMTVQPMFPVVAPFVGAGPQVVVYPDGTVIAEFAGVFDAQPMVWPYQAGHIDQDEVARLLALADGSGLYGEPVTQTMRPDVADAPVTTLTLRTDGTRSVTHQIVAVAAPAGTDEPDGVRAVREFVGALAAATESVRFSTAAPDYDPAVLAIAAAPVGDPRGDARPWPGAWPADAFAECRLVSDPTVIDELVGEFAGQEYVADGVTYAVAARVAFPHDLGC